MTGNNVHVTAHLIRVSDGSHIWSERYDRDITDIFAIQDEIASHIADKLRLTLFKTSASTEILPTKNMEAYEMWLKGNHFLRQGPKGRENAINYFRQAINLDSTYADGYIGLAWGYFFEFKNNREWLDRVKSAVDNALDHHVAEERAAELMVGVYMYEWNWTDAEKEYDKWFASNADGTAAHAVYLRMAHADFQKAIDMLKSIVSKDPLNVEALRMLGYSFTDDKQYDESRRVNRKILEIDPAYGDAYLSIGWNYFLEGNYKLAFENYDIAEKMQPGKSRLFHIITLAYDNKKWKH
jgi:tetratricopeptide (TPR) repeat protein